MIKHSIVELYVQYETLKGFKVKVLFNNLDARYVSKYRADIQKGKQWQDIIKKKKKTAVKVAYCLTYSWFRDTLYD